MKLSISITVLGSSLITAARLSPRQDNCARNNCYNDIWVSNPDLVIRGVLDCQRHLTTTEIVFPLVTSTFAEVTFTTTTTPCPTAPVSSAAATPALPSFAIGAKRNKGRQVAPSPSTSSTITRSGPVPTYATANCDTGNYRSACLCKSFFGITSALVNTISTTSTLYVTSTFTNTITTGTPCPTPSATATSFSSSSSSSSSNGTSSSSFSIETSSFVSSTGTISSASSTGTVSSSSSTSSSLFFNSSSSSSLSSSTDTTVLSSSTATILSSSSFSSNGTSSTPSSTSSISISTETYSSSSSSTDTSASSSATETSSSSSSTDSLSSSSSVFTISSSSASSYLSTSTLSTPTSGGYARPTPICNGNGVALCNGGCQDLRTSNDHCGACNNACTNGRTCANGVCTSTACDSTFCPVTMLRYCNNNGTSSCACAIESEGRGVCFDTNRFKCNGTTDPLNPRVDRCVSTSGCKIGFVCVREFCRGCNGTSSGICVSTEGCGRQGAENNGPLVSFGRMGRSRRLF